MQLKVSSRLDDITTRPLMPFCSSTTEELKHTHSSNNELHGPDVLPHAHIEVTKVLHDGLQQRVVSLDLLQQDHIEGGGVVLDQRPGALIIDGRRDDAADVSQELQHLEASKHRA